MLRRSIAGILCLLTIVNAASIQSPFKSDEPVHTTDSWGWESCGSDSDIIQIDSIQVSPDPPQPGKELTVKVKGVASETVEEGAMADVVVKLGLIKLLSKTFDLCDEARKANATIQCPIEAGEHDVTQVVELPKEIPKAKFKVNAQGYTEDEKDLFCVDLTIDFMKFPHVWKTMEHVKFPYLKTPELAGARKLVFAPSMPGTTSTFECLFEIENDTDEPLHVIQGDITMLIDSHDTISLVLSAGSMYHYILKHRLKTTKIS
ncbi:hypothetical protein V5O48_001617 [Marasmius crinis-equi]|uniref:Phosphatidylglycerol/phosphatidylinositol transfer protein n=1 Tax=Marasmius crinis-equi TaxID=585013 RepID=A0ABR3FXV0_9AGAR